MDNLINLIPFLAAATLILNPLLFFLFRRWKINIQKLRFWYMVSTALCWILLVLMLLINPESEIGLGYLTENSLLPAPIFLLDSISTSIGLTIGGLVLFSSLSQLLSPQQIAWISGIGGVSILGSLSGSVYSFLYFWALIEIFWITYSALFQSRDRGLILPVAFRLLVPLLLIYASGVGETMGEGSFIAYGEAGAPFLIAAGGLGIGAWIPFRRRFTGDDPGGNPEFVARLFPACLSLMVVTRGAALADPTLFLPYLPVLLGVFTLVSGLLGYLSRSEGFSRRIWTLGLLGMILGSSIQGSYIGSLGWGLVFLLPVSTLFFPVRDRSRILLALVFASLGLLTLPYFPAWIGRGIFSMGTSGVLFSIGAGLIIGGVLHGAITRYRQSTISGESVPLLFVISPIIILLTQIIQVLPHFSAEINSSLLSEQILVWIPLPIILIAVFFRDQIQDLRTDDTGEISGRTLDFLPDVIYWFVDLGDRLISFITGLFEGEGGLIWALLIGFLIITLITIRGGS
jgi:hypothetical protein